MGDRRAVAEQLGRNLRAQRRRAELSQEELADRSTLHRTAIGLIERGLREPRISTVAKLANALSIPAMDLLEGIE
ncbi:MAG TPA: helix-turn-helix transcriptional regulator [Solirubrobacterales bacterium]